jgi:hypothetical protein
MAITRSIWVDDDGSGTTGTPLNNAELQKIYNNIDALVTYGTWAPVDASGAGLVFTVSGARYARYDKIVVIQAAIQFPTTANTNRVTLGGLPIANGGAVGGFYAVSVAQAVQLYLPAATTSFYVNSGVGGVLTNNQFSGAGLAFSGVYLTA